MNKLLTGSFTLLVSLIAQASCHAAAQPQTTNTTLIDVKKQKAILLDSPKNSLLNSFLGSLNTDYYTNDSIEIVVPIPSAPKIKVNFGFQGSGQNKFEQLPIGSVELITNFVQGNPDDFVRALIENAVHKYLNSISKELASLMLAPQLTQPTVFGFKLSLLLKDVVSGKIELDEAKNEIFYLMLRLSLSDDLQFFNPEKAFLSHFPALLVEFIPDEIQDFIDETWAYCMDLLNNEQNATTYIPTNLMTMHGFAFLNPTTAKECANACASYGFDGNIRKVITDKGYETIGYSDLIKLGNPLMLQDPVHFLVGEKEFTAADADHFASLPTQDFIKIALNGASPVVVEGNDHYSWLLQPVTLGTFDSLQTMGAVIIKAFKEHIVLQNEYFLKYPARAQEHAKALAIEDAQKKFLASNEGIAHTASIKEAIISIENNIDTDRPLQLVKEIGTVATQLKTLRSNPYVKDVVNNLNERNASLKLQLQVAEKKLELKKHLERTAQQRSPEDKALTIELENELVTLAGNRAQEFAFEAMLAKNKQIAAVYAQEAQRALVFAKNYEAATIHEYSDRLQKQASQMTDANKQAAFLLSNYSTTVQNLGNEEIAAQKQADLNKLEVEIKSFLKLYEPNMVIQFLEKSPEFNQFIAHVTSDIAEFAPIRRKLSAALSYLWKNSEPVKENPVLFKYLVKSKFPALFPLLEEAINASAKL